MNVTPAHLLPPIPHIIEPPDWARLPIVENGEPLVPLENGVRLRVRAQYALDGIPNAPKTVWVRAGVRDRLHQAISHLPPDVALMVFDGFRPLAVQQYLYDHFGAHVAAEHPTWSPQEIEHHVRQYVALPEADPRRPPPHRTGGAVDVYLVDAATGVDLPMGTAPDEVAAASSTRFYEDSPQEPLTGNRRLLFHAMASAGFANYPGEWWHYDWGNQRWANITGAPNAVYGIAQEPGS